MRCVRQRSNWGQAHDGRREFFWYFETLCEQYAAAVVYGRDGRLMDQQLANALQAHLDALVKERVAGKEKVEK